MAQLLTILALSTNMMAENKMSELIRFFLCPLVDRGPVKLLKTLMGRTNVEDAVQRLDLLTESFSANSNETHVNVNDPNADMTGEIEGDTRTRLSTSRQHCLSVFIYVLTSFSLCFQTVVEEIEGISLHRDRTVHQHDQYVPIGNQLKERLRTWLSPPDPSINHNHARESQQYGTAGWFLQGDTFREWKNNGSVLWISGNRAPFLSFYHCGC